MLEQIHQIPPIQVHQINWEGDPLYYDLQLYQLGDGEKEFWALNPKFENSDVRFFIDKIPKSRKCLVFTYNGEWVVKLFKDGWYPYHGYETVEIIIPRLVWTRNPDIDPQMLFETDPRLIYALEYWDKDYELIWTMDSRFVPTDEKIWVYKAEVVGNKAKGTKYMEEVTPKVEFEYNTELEFLNLDYDNLFPAYYHLGQECVFVLDKTYTGNETVEVVKVRPTYKKNLGKIISGEVPIVLKVHTNPKLAGIKFNLPKDQIHYKDLKNELLWALDSEHLSSKDSFIWALRVSVLPKPKGKKIMGSIKPILTVKVNPTLPDLDFRIDYNIPWYDLKYEHLWMLDTKHTKTETEPMWAVKVTATLNVEGTKIIGNVEPHGILEINDNVTIPFEIPEDFAVQCYDFAYEHVWVVRENKEKIWVAKLNYINEPIGIKEIDITNQVTPDTIDVIFISYNEPNAEENWERVKEKAPWAQRVDGVKGILEAHKAAARLSRTDMFYVVDGDALLFKKWNFKYKPSIFDRDCTYIWSAKNSLADLTYGHGGVKLFSKEKLLKLKKWRTLDMTTSVSEKIKVMSEISNWAAFNTDPFSTWKTAFRECVKLAFNMNRYPDNPEHGLRLEKWKNSDKTQPFGEIAIDAANQALEFVQENSFDMSVLTKINDRDWLETLYNNTYSKAGNEQ